MSKEWAVTVEASTTTPVEAVYAAIPRDLHPSAGGAAGWVSVTATLPAPDPISALDQLVELVQGVAADFAFRGGEVTTLDEQRRRLEVPAIPDLVSLVDIAELAGVTKQRAWQIVEAKGFPPPAIDTRGGRMWLRSAVGAYLARPRRPGRPAGARTTE